MRLARIAAAAAILLASAAQAATRLTIATVITDPNRLNVPYPLQATGFPPYAVHPAQFDALTELDPQAKLAPALAQSWKAETPTTWLFDLRPGVRFSNGEPCDAAAVAATIGYLLSADGRRASAYREVQNVVRAEVRGALQVAITTDRPDVMLPNKLVSIKILPRLYFQKVGASGFNRAPVGTGPFTEKSRSPVRVELVRNPNAWRPAHVDELVIVALPDPTTRVQALASGQVDVALDVRVEDAGIVAAAGGRVEPFATGSVDTLQFVTVKPSPVQDVRVRQALNYAVNKQAIVDELLNGYTKPATQYASRVTFGYDPALHVPYPYDPPKAKALLAEAGYPNGFAFPVELMNSVDSAPYEQVAADLRAVGVRVTLTNIPVPAFTANYYQGTWHGLAFYFGYPAAPSLDALAPLHVHSCLWAHPWHCDESIAGQVIEVQGLASRDEREARTRAIMAQVRESAPAILLHESFKLVGLGSRIKAFPAPLGFVRYDLIELTP